MILRKLLHSTALAGLLCCGAEADAATTYVGPIQTYACAAHSWANSLAASTSATTCTQPAVGDLATVAAGTVLGNATGSTAAPTATSAPVLGIASTTAGSLGLYNSATAFAITLQNGGGTSNGATAAYNFNLPITVGGAGQVLTSQGGGTTPMTWSTVLTASFSVSSKTASFPVTSALDATRFDNAGAGGSVTFTLPASPVAGDNWCFLVAAAQTLVVLANTGETITMGNVTGASAGNLTASTIGSSVCVYFESATAAYTWASNGTWVLT
jgi:hypothetical protein